MKFIICLSHRTIDKRKLVVTEIGDEKTGNKDQL